MRKLYVVSVILRQDQPGSYTTKATMSYRQAIDADQAVGMVLRHTLGQFPGWGLQSYLVMEIPPEDVAAVYRDQDGQWTIEPPTTDIKETKEPSDEQPAAPSSD